MFVWKAKINILNKIKNWNLLLEEKYFLSTAALSQVKWEKKYAKTVKKLELTFPHEQKQDSIEIKFSILCKNFLSLIAIFLRF